MNGDRLIFTGDERLPQLWLLGTPAALPSVARRVSWKMMSRSTKGDLLDDIPTYLGPPEPFALRFNASLHTARQIASLEFTDFAALEGEHTPVSATDTTTSPVSAARTLKETVLPLEVAS
jgi:hypothetical protein